MKKAGLFAVSLLALLVPPGGLRADSNDPEPESYTHLDPDGVPLAVTQGSAGPTSAQVEALRQEVIQQERDRNWLMIDYAQQVRLHSHDSTVKRPNIYLQLGMDKSLSQLAGLDALDPTESDERPPSLHAAPTPSARNAPSLRPAAPTATGAFTPLVSPLSPFSASATQSYSIPIYSTLIPSILAPRPDGAPAGVVRVNGSPEPAPALEAHSTSYMEAMDLQTPGMVAAKDNPVGETEVPDLSLDALPAEAATAPDELPQKMDADQLHVDQTSRLKAPTASNSTNTASAQPPVVQPQAAQGNPADAPVPVTQQQQLAPVHPPIANPFDILNR